MLRKLHRFRLGYPNSRLWRLRLCPARGMTKGRLGECDPNERELAVWQGLQGEDLLKTALHEAIHAEMPHLSEEAVESASQHLGDVVWRLRGRI